MYLQEWQSSCIMYRTLKINLELERYLILLDCIDKINICRFRCRNIKIPIVTLGYTNRDTLYENRLCTICDMNEIGDESHYILRCPVFQSHRTRYISSYFIRNPNIAITQLFQSSNVSELRKLSKFISVINRQFR